MMDKNEARYYKLGYDKGRQHAYSEAAVVFIGVALIASIVVAVL